MAAPARPAVPTPAPTPAATPAPAAASPAAPPAAPRPAPALDFQAMDADHNGRVTLEEWRNFQEREFRRHDANNDGVLTQDELGVPSRKPTGPAARAMP
nr:EF-hand domain-containing protein [Desulfovibrio sp. DV]